MWEDLRFPTRSTSAVQIREGFPQTLNTAVERGILVDQRFDALEAVDHRRVVAATECIADFHELHAEELADEKHCNLTGHRELLGAALGAESFDIDAELARDGLLDRLHVERVFFFRRPVAI